MEEIFGFIIMLMIFVVGPLLEQAKRKKQGKPPVARKTPQQSRTRELPTPAQPRVPVPAGRSEPEEFTAADLLPDDLWEVLTGQPRPRPAPLPAPDVDVEDLEDEEAFTTEDVGFETRRRPAEEAVSLEVLPRRELPVVVSLEMPPPSPSVRHAAFHKKLDLDMVPATVTAYSRNRNFELVRGSANLRRAVLLQTVLGPPKALE